jgi:rhodanese-related sulfurtransferase
VEEKMKNMWKMVLGLLVAFGLVAGLSACSTPEKVDMASVTAVIDVRTPAEFAEGHLDGALNINLESGNFASEISQLDPAGTYLIYCRSGNRSGQAITQMEAAGFTNLTNLGGYADASASTGIPLVK